VVMGYISYETCSVLESVDLLTVLVSSVDEDGGSSRRVSSLWGDTDCDIAIMLSTTSFILGRFNGSRTQQR
jgi:hypothetical protein